VMKLWLFMPSNIHVGNLTITADKVHEMDNDYHIFGILVGFTLLLI